MPEIVNLSAYAHEDGYFTPDDAPLGETTSTQDMKCVPVAMVPKDGRFHVNLWPGRFKGIYYSMQVLRKNDRHADCLWLSEAGKLLRNKCGESMFSQVKTSTMVYVKKPTESPKRKLEDTTKASKKQKVEPIQKVETTAPPKVAYKGFPTPAA